MTPARSYLVCASPRSGSTVLCRRLADTGVAGRPEEYFEARRGTGVPRRSWDWFEGQADDPELREILGEPPGVGPEPAYSSLRGVASYEEHLRRSLAQGTTPNGVFGAKLMWGNVADFAALAAELPRLRGLEPAELLDAAFGSPRLVWVRRRDAVRQAVSLWRAIQTQRWRSSENGVRAREPVYSFRAIAHLVDHLRAEDRGWEAFFAAHPRAPLTLHYEDFADGVDAAAAEVLGWLGLDPRRLPASPPPLERQADAVAEAWVAAYREQSTPSRA